MIGSQEAGEFRVFKGITKRAWRPFKAIEVGPDGRPTLVRFTEDEIAAIGATIGLWRARIVETVRSP